MLSKGVEREKERTEKSLTYYTGFQVVIYGNTNRGSNSIQRQRLGVGLGKGKAGEKKSVLMKYLLDRGGSTSEHDYVIRSRSRDRTSSTREPRAFSSHLISLRATHYSIRTNGLPLFDVNVLHVSDPSRHSKSP